MTSIQFELEPHEYGVIYDVHDSAIYMNDSFLTLLKTKFEEVFVNHPKIIHDSFDYREELFQIENKKTGAYIIIMFMSGVADEVIEELMKYKKYSVEWNEVWDDIKTMGAIDMRQYDKNGNLINIPERVVEHVRQAIAMCVDEHTNSLI